MSPEFRTDDLDRLRTVERDVTSMKVTLGEHGVVLTGQSESLARIEGVLAKMAEHDVHKRVSSLEEDRENRRRRIGKVIGWGAGIVATVVAAIFTFLVIGH